jgi:hypothetical protein
LLPKKQRFPFDKYKEELGHWNTKSQTDKTINVKQKRLALDILEYLRVKMDIQILKNGRVGNY